LPFAESPQEYILPDLSQASVCERPVAIPAISQLFPKLMISGR